MNVQTILLLLIVLPPLAVSAQSPEAAEQLPVVEVVAERSSITQPGSSSELSADDLRVQGIQKLDDLHSRAPNLIVRSGGSRSLNHVLGFRGMVNNAFYGEPAVALYVDDVPYASTLTYDTSLLEIDHIDIFRGPQFTRWGRRGAAGLISIHSRPPGDQFGIRAETDFSSHDSQSYKLHMDGPLGRELGFTLSGGYSRRDGYLYNDFRDVSPDYQEALSGRFSLLWRPSDRLDVQFIAAAQHYDDGVQRYTNLDSSPYRIEHDFAGITKGRSDVESVRIRYTGDDLMFTSVTARRDFRLDPASLDLDFSPQPILPTFVYTDQIQYSQEFRLQPVREGPLDWFAGAYASWADTDLLVDDNVFRGDSRTVDKTLAVFGEVTKKFDNKVDLTLGLRGEVVEKSVERALRAPDGSVSKRDMNRTDSNVSPKLTLTKHLSDEVLIHAGSALNFRPGAYSVFNFNPEINSADMEQNWANEIGVKAHLLDDALEISLTGFWYEIDDYQIERYVLSGFGVFTADEVVSRGVELEVLARPFQGLELSGSAGYINAEFQDYRSGADGKDLAGRHPPYIPEVTASLAAQYRHPSGPMARVEWLLNGRTFFEDSNTDSGAQSAYSLFNARIGYERKNWGVYLYGRNLTDRDYYTLKIPTLGVGFPGDPRTVGVMATVSF